MKKKQTYKQINNAKNKQNKTKINHISLPEKAKAFLILDINVNFQFLLFYFCVNITLSNVVDLNFQFLLMIGHINIEIVMSY